MEVNKILIISDSKPGHLNQSIAYAKLKDLDYDILELSNISKFKKLLSYVLDFFHIYINLFDINTNKQYKAIVSTGSNTYYANKYLSKKLNIQSIAIMLPKGFRYSDFDYIIAQEHDNPPKLNNVIIVPVNLSINEPKSYIQKAENYKHLGLIIGGDNKIFKISKEQIKNEIDKIFKHFPNHKKLVTTSRRTPKDIEKLCESYAFDYKLIYSQNPNINPIPDFIDICDELYITSDSTSMISEAAANSDANINIIMLNSEIQNTKYHKLIDIVKSHKSKINLKDYLKMI